MAEHVTIFADPLLPMHDVRHAATYDLSPAWHVLDLTPQGLGD
jgi:hypothetical protein